MYGQAQEGPAAGATRHPSMIDAAVTTLLPLDELDLRLEEALKRVDDAATTLRNVADLIMGAVPESEVKMPTHPGQPVRPGKVGGLADRTQTLHMLLGQLEAQVRRFALFVG